MALVKCRECGKEVSTEAVHCPNCGATTKISAGARRILIAAACVLSIALVAPVLLRAVQSEDESPSTAALIASAPDNPMIDKRGPRIAWKMARELIARALKSPSSASYAPLTEWEFADVDENSWRVKAWVESANPLGVLLRSNFTAILTVDSNDYWRVEYLKFDDEPAIGKYRMTKAEQAAAMDKKRRQEEDQRRRLQMQNAVRLEEAEAAMRRFNEHTAAREAAAKEAEQMKADQDALMARLAERKLAAVQAAIDAKFHKWTSANGKYTFEAELTKVTAGTLTLVDIEGNEKEVQIDQVSEKDRGYIEQWRKDRHAKARVIPAPVREKDSDKSKRSKKRDQ